MDSAEVMKSGGYFMNSPNDFVRCPHDLGRYLR
ncbi:hypothetical protein ABIC27_002984 [Streptomyces sp. PvR034]